MSGGARRLAILAGGGGVPREIADSAAARGIPVSIVAIDGEADADFSAYPLTRVNWGQIGAMLRAMKRARATELVIVGRVHRPELKGLKPDLGLFRYLPKIIRIVAAGGDDSVLRRVVRFFEQQGLRVVSPGEAAPELVVREGPLGSARSGAPDRADIALGYGLVRALGPYDIGQSVIVRAGRIEAVEGAEGTDRMIARAAKRRATSDSATSTLGGVLVKRSKPAQDMRVDMPVIGPATVDGAKSAGLSGIAVEAGRVLVADRRLTASRADGAAVFVEGVADSGPETPQDAPPRRFDPRVVSMPFRCLTRATPERHAVFDAIKAIAVLDALDRFDVGRAAVVVRNHVLAVEAGGEGVEATLARAAGLRQWASLTHRRRGIAALRSMGDLTPAVIERVASAGYAGIAISDAAASETALPETIRDANARGIVVILRADRNAAS
ncbi:MAG: UDP-2,3-diacylglucosamine diphosphatase LpxI [Hyphomicrobium sp.]|uniref:UDP-2,3-diacylglucosamine diphosphatase LpxI domain-containing protein n=1 Tax=Hyphomicrobium sp. TaxID=82 RepID=UPI003D0AF250